MRFWLSSSVFSLSFSNNIFAETFLLEEQSPLPLNIWINERKSGLGEGDNLENFLERNRIPPPILHIRETLAGDFLKKLLYAKYENGLKISRWWEFWLNRLFSWDGVVVWGQRPLHLMIFLTTLHIKTDAHHGALPHWKMKSLKRKTNPNHWKVKPLSGNGS